jgi:hypothetical protein
MPFIYSLPTTVEIGEERGISGKDVADYEETAFKKIVECTKITDLRHLGIFLHKIRCEWGHYMRKLGGGDIIGDVNIGRLDFLKFHGLCTANITCC